MTGFDVIAILVILGSAAAGWVRGGTREIITLLSFVLAAFIALVALPVTAPIGRGLIDPDWAGTILAAIASFAAVSALFVLPTYPTLLAAVEMDDTGSTRIGKAVFNHPFFIPGVATIAMAVALGFFFGGLIL